MPELRKVAPPKERHGIPLGAVIDGPRVPPPSPLLNNNNNDHHKSEENHMKPMAVLNGNGKLLEEIKSARLKPTEPVMINKTKKGTNPRDDLMAAIRSAEGGAGLRKVQTIVASN